MTAYILVKYIHLVSILGMVCTLFTELVLVGKTMTRKEINRVSKYDSAYGILAIIVVAAGLTLWFGVGKPAEFYDNPIFYFKVGIVILVGILSIIPTVFYIKQRKGDQDEIVEIPPRVKAFIIIQLGILGLVPILATMMAFGLRI